MNTTSEHDRDLAAKLRSLSIEPAAFKTEPPEPHVRRRVIPGAMLALAATASLVVVLLNRPETLGCIETMLAGLIDKEEAAISVNGSDVPAAGPIRAPPSNNPADRALPSREVTGSGYVVAPDIAVAEANIALMRPGLRGEAVLDGFPDRPFAVEVSKIAPMISREKGTVTLRLSLSSPPSDMRPAMAARIRLLVGEAGDNTDHQQGAER
nr:hypothetical protein [Rhizobium laguerreae]